MAKSEKEKGIERARDTIRITAAASHSRMGGRNKTAEKMAKQVERDEKKEKEEKK